MSAAIKTVMVRDFIGLYEADENVFVKIPEFSFLKPLAFKYKQQQCFCGLGEQMQRAILTFNEVVDTLDAETLTKLKELFQSEGLCFGIQTQSGFSTKCY